MLTVESPGFGLLLKRYRQDVGMTQEELAERELSWTKTSSVLYCLAMDRYAVDHTPATRLLFMPRRLMILGATPDPA